MVVISHLMWRTTLKQCVNDVTQCERPLKEKSGFLALKLQIFQEFIQRKTHDAGTRHKHLPFSFFTNNNVLVTRQQPHNKKQQTTNKFLFASSGVVLTASLCSIEACEEKRFQGYCALGLFTHSFKFDLQKWHAREARVMFQWVHIVRATQVVHMTATLTLRKDRRRQ